MQGTDQVFLFSSLKHRRRIWQPDERMRSVWRCCLVAAEKDDYLHFISLVYYQVKNPYKWQSSHII